jgi:Tol biopolymer transport system component
MLRRFILLVPAALLACTCTTAGGTPASSGQGERVHPPVTKRNLFGRIAYSTRGGDIWVMNANGTCRHRVTRSGTGLDFDPSWAPDGKRLVFRTSRGHYQPDVYSNGLEGLFVVNVDGSNEREIQPPTGGMFADWSPRGDRIAFSGLRPGATYDTLFLMNPDGTGLRDLGTPRGSEGAVWSPDASRIEYGAHNGDGNWAIWTMRSDGTQQRQLTHPHLVFPAGSGGDNPGPWSPDGRRIAYSSRQFRDREVWIMNADGSHRRRVTHWPGGDGPLAWLPNGRIVFAHFRGDEPLPGFYWMKPNGTGIRSLPLLRGAGDPIEWLPHAAPDPRCPREGGLGQAPLQLSS